ncbi:hypothetical protein, partial [Mumia xiangluensis]
TPTDPTTPAPTDPTTPAPTDPTTPAPTDPTSPPTAIAGDTDDLGGPGAGGDATLPQTGGAPSWMLFGGALAVAGGSAIVGALALRRRTQG